MRDTDMPTPASATSEEMQLRPTQSRRQLKVEDALAYLDQVKETFFGQPEVYNSFLDMMKEFKAQEIDTPTVIGRVITLFRGHDDLIRGFNTFLPPGYTIDLTLNGSVPLVRLTTRQSPPPPPPPSRSIQSNKKHPIEFDTAVSYVTKVKQRFAHQPQTYRAFLEALHTYQKEKWTLKRVYQEVSELFRDHSDLLIQFHEFLPDDCRVHLHMKQWRRKARLIGRLMTHWRRASARAYAPGGLGFEACREEFAGLVRLPSAAHAGAEATATEAAVTTASPRELTSLTVEVTDVTDVDAEWKKPFWTGSSVEKHVDEEVHAAEFTDFIFWRRPM